jgi:hypothetical protein
MPLQASYKHDICARGATSVETVSGVRNVRRGIQRGSGAYPPIGAAVVHTLPPVAAGNPASTGMMIWTVGSMRIIIGV